ncbi:MAG: glycosyltransferase [Candidatus Nanoarchaeia archaeon]
MPVLPYIYLGYMFIAIYFLTFFLILYTKNRKNIFKSPKLTKRYTLSVLIPAYNEEESIQPTIEAVMNSDYELKEVIVINDGSTDKTVDKVKEMQKKYKILKLLNKRNTGKADSLNKGIAQAKGELIAITDSDSFPQKDAISKLIGFFDDEKVGAATPLILVRNKNKFFEKLQAFEYAIIALTRKLLSYVDAIYVTPGPLAIYRRKALQEVGGFDPNNITEDIELTWRLAAEGWKREMSLQAKVTTIVPNKLKKWFKQRQRWSIGGTQTIWKYKNYFLRKGITGYFILPFFVVSTFLGLLGLCIFLYLAISRIINQYFFLKFTFVAETAVVSLDSLYFTPSVLNYLGVVLFIASMFYTFFLLYLIKEDTFRKKNFFTILFYLVAYLAIYPVILVTAIFKLLRKDISW